MKTLSWIFMLLMLAFFGSARAQSPSFYPIPSYNIAVEGSTDFQETFSVNSRGKRDINVHIHHKNLLDTSFCSAVVYIYSFDLEDKLGPFTVNCGETLIQEIDERMWGVTVESEYAVVASVWINELNKSGIRPNRQAKCIESKQNQ